MNRIHWTVLSLIAAVALFVGGFVLVGNFTQTTNPSGVVPAAAVTTVNMNGTWTQTSGLSGTTMTGTISDGSISIQLSDGDTSGLYWKGTFPVDTILSDGFTVTSAGDTTALSSSIFASQDSTKVFTYKDGSLNFSFSILGTTTTVHLQRSAE
jgi:hypothetical protein